ncbi:MAG: toll/interleukin-1 receptor domain-containing protein [Chloroflexaceae bacterium]
MHTEKLFDVFISHAFRERDLVDQLARALEAQGLKVFLPERDIQPGEDIVDAIDRAMAESRYTLLIISPAFLDSQWANFETGVALSRARSHRMQIIPVLTAGVAATALPFGMKGKIHLDATDMNVNELSLQLSRIFADLQGKAAPVVGTD